MGKDKKKKGPKSNVFKVAGAKSLKKTKAKAVNLGLKNIKHKVADIDKQLIEINKNSTPNPTKQHIKLPDKRPEKKVTTEEVAKTTEEMVKMDL